MKKLFVLFVAVAATISSFAATRVNYFNRTQFQWSGLGAEFIAKGANYDVELTVPIVYRGTVALKADWAYEPAQNLLTLDQRQAAPCLITAKSNLPAIMTLCQPCIDCYPCDVLDVEATEDGKVKDGIAAAKVNVPYLGITPGTVEKGNKFGNPGFITNWNLYLVLGVNKAAKVIYVVAIDLTADANKGTFFTGAKKKNMYVKVASAGGHVQMQLTGAKNDYKFKFYENYLKKNDDGFGVWDANFSRVAQTAYIKSAASLAGTIYYNRYTPAGARGTDDPTQVEILDVAGTVKLTRDATWTGRAIAGAFSAEVQKNGKGWDNCTIVAPAQTCEMYFYEYFEEAYFGAAYRGYTFVDADGNPAAGPVATTAEDVFAAAYDVEERFLGFNAEELP